MKIATAARIVPRNALVWIIISQFALLAPHLGRLPLWVVLVYLFAAGWRIMVYQGRWSFPGRWVKLGLIAAGFAAIWLSYGNLLGLEPTVALLLTAFALKLLELIRRKDAYVLIFLGYFICVTGFLFTQHLLLVLYSMLDILLLTTALVALHQPGEHRFRLATVRLPAVMLAQALPLMLVLFFLFPRLGPLWTVPVKSHAARTGVSDFMQPGDISSLSQSDEVAFRVQFDGDIPPRSELYWRGLVFSVLENGAWRSLKYADIPAREWRARRQEPVGEPLRYSVLMMPTQQNWLYSLRYAQSAQRSVMASADFRLYSPVEIEDQLLYRATSWPRTPLELELSAWRRRTELALPAAGNPATLALARQLRAASDSDADYVTAVLDHFNREPFVYTLQPPLLGEDPMDQFLFRTRRGFCEHYAFAFTLMMRAAGVPARVVAGYQGGEINPVNGTVIVHQFDAHAWAEVWLPGEGWRRVDPTAAVAPERIELGLEQALAGEGSFLADSPLSPLRYRGINWINMARLRYDALTYRWQSWVVGFDSQQQYQLLEDVFGDIRPRVFIAVLFASALVVLLPVAWLLLGRRQRHSLDPATKLYLAFCVRLAARGIVRAAGEAPADFARRAALEQPALAPWLRQFTHEFNQLAYADREQDEARRQQLLARLRSLLRQPPPA
ncbi:transglutaminase TgpA family protein [Kineobactrum salinum]|uniref:DUF3488 domain-containing transglutaminase family protein n=1 Tax=Kineobactrum salinum TaxID=2708301 RepID=A0A6C0U8C3_9GAMM|nr:DUF3488 and transglutaminase-like domain-containing protein [Kineobactrum salinum]QIB67287.1 DUF3488 domain-containing transglutaminase family protein [Kineobactrum salinum]